MRTPRLAAPLVAVALSTLLTACIEQDATLTIRADGTCVARLEYRMPRAEAHMHLETMAEDWPDADKPAKPYAKMTDAELAAALREATLRQMREDDDEGERMKLEAVTVKDGVVRLAVSVTIGSLAELVEKGGGLGEMMPGVRRMVAETDDKGRLRLTLTPSYGDAEEAAQKIKQHAFCGGRRLVLPGRVLSSSLPHTKGNATWVAVDPKQPETVAALARVLGKPVVIVAESGGLRLPKRLDSRPPKYPETLPVAEAGPGSLVQPVAVTVVRYHLLRDVGLPDPNRKRALDQSQGVTIQADVAAPEGRFLIAVERIRALAATDEQGRPIPPAAETKPKRRMGPAIGPARVTLRLGLPARDARTIHKLDGEAIALTGTGWKQMTVDGAKLKTRQKIDISRILPGASMSLHLSSMRWRDVRGPNGLETTRRWQMHWDIRGPETIHQLDVLLKFPGDEEPVHPQPEHDHVGEAGEKWHANGAFRHDHLGPRHDDDVVAPAVILRMPKEFRRERIPFTVHRIPLYRPKAERGEL